MRRAAFRRFDAVFAVLACALAAPALAQQVRPGPVGPAVTREADDALLWKSSGSCADLWSDRNAIYKAAGYCFRSQRGIQAFGNAGCQFDDEADVPLSARQREEVAQIRATERRLGCTP